MQFLYLMFVYVLNVNYYIINLFQGVLQYCIGIVGWIRGEVEFKCSIVYFCYVINFIFSDSDVVNQQSIVIRGDVMESNMYILFGIVCQVYFVYLWGFLFFGVVSGEDGIIGFEIFKSWFFIIN